MCSSLLCLMVVYLTGMVVRQNSNVLLADVTFLEGKYYTGFGGLGGFVFL